MMDVLVRQAEPVILSAEQQLAVCSVQQLAEHWVWQLGLL
jgi:hypothetical protein